MISFQEKFHQSLKEWLERRGLDVVEIIDYYDDAYSDDACSTCGGDAVIEVVIKYTNSEGAAQLFVFDGSFSEILKELV